MDAGDKKLTKQDLLQLMDVYSASKMRPGFTVQDAKNLPSYNVGEVDPSFIPPPPAVVAQSDMPGAAMSAEDMRHSLTQLAPQAAPAAVPAAAPPMAPPLPGPDNAAATPGASPAINNPLTGNPAPDVTALAQDEMQRGQALEGVGGGQMMLNRSQEAAGIAAGALADKQTERVKADEKIAQGELDKQGEMLAKQEEAKQKAIAERGEAAANEQISRIHSAADEAAQASVHDFWQDKSAGARILGVLSQMMAGAANGIAGNPSAPTPLDRIIARDLEVQQLNLQQKNRKLDNERSVLRDLFEQTGSAQQANAAYYMAAWKRIGAQANVLKAQFANPTADAAAKKIDAVAQQRMAQASDKTYSELLARGIQEGQHGLNILSEQQNAETRALGAAAAAGAAANGKDRFILPGFKGTVSGEGYKDFKEATEGYTTVMAQARAIQQIAVDYRNNKISEADAIQQYNVARALLLTAQRKVQGTGAALSDPEAANLEKVLPQLGSHFFLPAAFDADLEHQAERITAASSRSYLGFIHNRVAGIELNDEDPEYGAAVRNFRSELVRQHRSGVR